MDTQELPRRVYIIGKTGSGKSTLSKKVSKALDITHVELDNVLWEPNWQQPGPDEMHARLDANLPADGGWVADGNWRSLADITWPRAELVVWLDYPIWLVLWRLVQRTLRRTWTQEAICNGNRESLWTLFALSPETNLLLECWRQQGSHAREFVKLAKEYGEEKTRRFTGPAECERWLEALEDEARHARAGGRGL